MIDRPPVTDWRGSTAAQAETAERDASESASGRVLVLMRHDGNRRQVVQLLEKACNVLVPDSNRLAPDAFDLVLTDIPGLKEWSNLLLDAKFKAEPTFLPVVLILSRNDLKQSVKSFWDVIDEFIVSPIEPRELLERVALLLRTRRLALAQQTHLAYVVNHDRVTGLPNRNLFMNRVTDAVRDAAVLGLQVHVSVLHLPLARVLKSLGHHGLDTAAARISARLAALVGEDATLARLTTEDWGLVHRPGASLQEVLSLLTQAGAISAEPVDVGGEQVHLTPRIGVGIYPLDGTGAGTVLDHALAALETASTPTPVFYSREVQHTALRSIRIEARLHKALEEGQLELWYQPQVDIASRKAYAVEALVRWRLPNGELVQPGQFLPVAQETGLIRDIGSWAVRAACKAISDWRSAGLGIERVGVNLTAQDLQADGFLDQVHEALEANGLPPECLELELTESDLIETGNGNIT